MISYYFFHFRPGALRCRTNNYDIHAMLGQAPLLCAQRYKQDISWDPVILSTWLTLSQQEEQESAFLGGRGETEKNEVKDLS